MGSVKTSCFRNSAGDVWLSGSLPRRNSLKIGKDLGQPKGLLSLMASLYH